MAFVIEEIPEEAKKKYNFGIGISRWVIDYERNIFMVSAGGTNYGKIRFFNMYVANEIAGITAERQFNQINLVPAVYEVKYTVIPASGRGNTISWRDIPTTQLKINYSPKQLVEEALKIYGFTGDPEIINKTEVEFQEHLTNKGKGIIWRWFLSRLAK